LLYVTTCEPLNHWKFDWYFTRSCSTMYCFAPGAGLSCRTELVERAVDRDLVDGVVLQVEVEADLAGVGDFLAVEWHDGLRE
jgi:hypothetical protein